MSVTSVRIFIGRTIQGFAFVCLLLQQVFFRVGSSAASTSGPDPTHGLIFPCYPKFEAWFYSDFTIARSWDLIVCMMLILLGGFISWDDSTGSKSRGFSWAKTPSGWSSFALGALLAFGFVVYGEYDFILWAVAHGFRPPAISCSPLFAG